MKKLALVLSLLIVLSSPAYCFVVPFEGIELEEYSELVVRGRVLGMESVRESARGLIYTDVEVEVSEYLKGSGGDVLTVRFVGGEVGGTGLLVGNMPRFRTGEAVFLFLQEAVSMPGDTAGVFEVVGSAEGKIPVPGDTPDEEEPDEEEPDGEEPDGEELEALHTGYNFLRAHNGSFLNWYPADIPIDITVSTWRMSDLGWVNAVYAALAPWSDVTTASVSFDYRGTVPYRLSAEEDGINMVGWTAYAWVGGNEYPSAAAVALIWYNSDSNYIKEVDIAFNSFLQWTMTGEFNKFDVQGIATHELGHLLGLGHTSQFVAQGGILTTMIDGNDFFGTLGYGIEETYLLRSLHTIDMQGVTILYPPGYPDSELPRGPTGACFIATAAYGSPLSRGVYALSGFRDSFLMESGAGRAFVSAYYSTGPYLARAIEKNFLIKSIIRLHLSPIICIIDKVNQTGNLSRGR